MNNKALMIQGTASGVGKSVIVAGLCRLLARNGVKVAPFKPQNMSNNAAVTVDGGEIGRAQALQALACGIEPTVHMNPVLIKPENNQQAQLIVRGQVKGRLHAKRFRQDRLVLLDTVLDSFSQLQQDYDFIMIEGAGCSAEPNLRQGDIANMGFAEAADVPVWLLGDIDCGGVFAALKGCLDIVDEQERGRIQALLINRFRGNLSLLDEAIVWLENTCAKPLAGVIPMLELDLPEEDAPFKHQQENSAALFRINVLAYPRMSNHDDIDPLAADAHIQVRFVRSVADWQACDLVILPGSKHVSSDLAWLRQQGFEPLLQQHLRYAGHVLGICGGLQMLGESIEDGGGAEKVEGESCRGLAYLALTTQMQTQKTLRQIDQLSNYPIQARVTGYEIHHGDSAVDEALFPFAAVSADKQVWATYVHGVFEQGKFRQAWLQSLGFKQAADHDQQQRTLDSLDKLADELEQSIQPQFLRPLLAAGAKPNQNKL